MKGYSSVTFAIRVVTAIVLLVSVWMSLNDYKYTLKELEMRNTLQGIAEYTEAKVMYSLKMLQNPEFTYFKEKLYLPDLREDYSVSISCQPNNLLTINASAPIMGVKYIIKDYINCSSMALSGTLLPNGERCVTANKTSNSIRIELVNNCDYV
jgi:hypothetical protein